ncbi:MAG: ArsA family ATPase [Acidimicrobiales bacterium]|nr:ArsA family ATPase [Acidimicrobiales bacterium]
MDPSAFFTSSAVHIVAGKGGVGKTTLTAGLGLAAASLGLDVLLVEIEGRGGLPGLFGRNRLHYREETLAQGVRARSLSAEEALVEYLADHGFGPLARRMIDTGLVEVVSRGAPGMKDILLLGKIKQLERAGAADVILVDAPASGHAVTFLRSPRGLLDAVASGPINSQAREVLELLTDAARCQVLLVTTAEETPINELVETAFSLEDEIGLHLGPVLVNGVLPDRHLPADVRRAAKRAGVVLDVGVRRALETASAYVRRRVDAQQSQLSRLDELLPLTRLTVAQRPTAGLAHAHLPALADELLAAIRAA